MNKTERAQAVAPYVARGLVYIPGTQPFAEGLMAQTDVFPNAKVRDLADALIQGLLYAFSLYTFGTAMAPAFTDMRSDKPDKAAPVKQEGLNKPPAALPYAYAGSEEPATRTGLF